jgi:transposase
MLADQPDYVVAVDTHRDEHLFAVIAAITGAVLARQVVQANGRGCQAALRFAGEAAHGARAWAVEGTGSYGAGFARYLADRGETVLEVGRSPRSERRLRGKDDALDAVRTARAALASEELALPRNGERREALRLLLVARRSAVDVRRQALGQLRGVIVTAPDRLREELRLLPTGSSTAPCTRSSSTAASTTPRPGGTSHDGPARARAAVRPHGCSSATSHATSTGYCKTRSRRWLDRS